MKAVPQAAEPPGSQALKPDQKVPETPLKTEVEAKAVLQDSFARSEPVDLSVSAPPVTVPTPSTSVFAACGHLESSEEFYHPFACHGETRLIWPPFLI